VRAFVDFLVERLNFDTDYMEVLCPNRKCYETVTSTPSPEAVAEVSGRPDGEVPAAEAAA
jgi:hypothetical protein